MEERPFTILVAEDDPGNLALLKKILSAVRYEVISAVDGMEVLEIVKKKMPDLFLLDVMMPKIDGLEVCRRLKEDESLHKIPVIFITSKDRTDDILAGFEAGAADYITKPVKEAEMLARVRTQIRLYHSILELERLNQLALDANPLTGLPGNNSVADAITRAIENHRPLCVIYCDMDNFKAFNDKYGFARGDRAIQFTADTIRGATRSVCGSGFFIGHIGGDDFSILVPSEKAKAVADEIARRFDEGVAKLYDPEDLEACGIVTTDREGQQQIFPLMALSMGGVYISKGTFKHYLEVSNLCAEVKKIAKGMQGSSVFFDRREDNSD